MKITTSIAGMIMTSAVLAETRLYEVSNNQTCPTTPNIGVNLVTTDPSVYQITFDKTSEVFLTHVNNVNQNRITINGLAPVCELPLAGSECLDNEFDGTAIIELSFDVVAVGSTFQLLPVEDTNVGTITYPILGQVSFVAAENTLDFYEYAFGFGGGLSFDNQCPVPFGFWGFVASNNPDGIALLTGQTTFIVSNDYNSDGIVDVNDLLAFLADDFAGTAPVTASQFIELWNLG